MNGNLIGFGEEIKILFFEIHALSGALDEILLDLKISILKISIITYLAIAIKFYCR